MFQTNRNITLLLLLASAFLSTVARADDDRLRPAAERIGTGRHLIATSQQPLTDGDRASLAARGLTVQHVMPGNRYVVRAVAGASLDAGDDILQFAPISLASKLHPSAWKQAARAGAFAQLNVLFHEDVSFAEAAAAVSAVGGTLDRPLESEFQEPRRISVRVPSATVAMLAGDDRVLAVYGPRPRVKVDNVAAANLSEVTPLFDAPYGLTGKGVVVSIFDVGQVDASHKDFGGRVTTHTSQTIDLHPTHVSGTILGSGENGVGSKGMAPGATLHAFDVNDNNGDFITAKRRSFNTYGARADNNSWGYVLGWSFDSSDGVNAWVWEDADEYIAAYDYTDATIDKLVRSSGVTIVFSSGNEADTTGPTSTPFKHYHVDDQSEVIKSEIFCYSANGSGTDCPVPTCSAGPSHCETTRHPVRGPFNTVGLTGSSKNVIAVGAVDSSAVIATFSSRGPTVDGRVKPDLVAKGVRQYSTEPNNKYGNLSGTSMAAPVVTGISALLIEQWRKSFNGANPVPSAVKSLLVAGARDLGNSGPDYTYGFGLVDAKNTVDLLIADNGEGRRIRTGSLAQGEQRSWNATVTATGNLRVVLSWDDPEVLLGADDFAAAALVNDLDLQITGPDGNVVLPYVLDKDHVNALATRAVNHVDNTEEVEIRNAAPGKYHISVTASTIAAQSPQSFVLVSTAEVADDTQVPPPPTATPTRYRAARH